MASSYGPKKEDVYGCNTYFREVGYFITRKELYERALHYFDEALKRTPEDKRALVGRSWARAKACHYKGALSDINKALSLDSGDLLVLAHKALNTFLSCEFEEALVQNLRLLPQRKKPDSFVMGVMHCNEAIENCVGKRAGKPLRDHFKIIRRLAWKKAFEVEKPFEAKNKRKMKKKKDHKSSAAKTKGRNEPVAPQVMPIKKKPKARAANTFGQETDDHECDEKEPAPTEPDESDLEIKSSLYTHDAEEDMIPPFKDPFPYRPLQNYTSNIKNYMAERYLDSMYLDKIFLEELMTHPGITSPNKEGTKKILKMCKSGYKSLVYKQELLRTRRPFYYIKFQEASLSGTLKARQEAELNRQRAVAKKEADKLLENMLKLIEDQESRHALDMAEKLKVFCDSKSKKVLPDREKYLKEIYETACQAHFILKRLNETQFQWDQEKRIYEMLGTPVSRQPSDDSVLNQFKGVLVDYKKLNSIYEDRLRKATKPDEIAWLYHELSRFTIELKKYELARVYARKCIQVARTYNNQRWVINAMMLITKVNLLQHSRNDAKAEVCGAIEIAKSMNDDGLVKYLQKTLEVVEKIEFDELGVKILEKREQQIIQMMSGSEMKDEVTYLFAKMSAMPAARRMSVMPGVKLNDPTDTKAMAAKKMSIMPSSRGEDDELASAAKAGDGKEVGFMEQIQFHVDS